MNQDEIQHEAMMDLAKETLFHTQLALDTYKGDHYFSREMLTLMRNHAIAMNIVNNEGDI